MSINVQSIEYTPKVEELLRQSALLTGDIRTDSSIRFVGIHEGSSLIGVAGLEPHGRFGLLRSLAVAESHRGKDMGALLVKQIETLAAEQGITKLYLLTTTAADFFLAQGYQNANRSEAPVEIASTKQFSGLCPSSSTFMAKELTANPSLRLTA